MSGMVEDFRGWINRYRCENVGAKRFEKDWLNTLLIILRIPSWVISRAQQASPFLGFLSLC
jgi:hypothetical protein